MRFQRIGKKGQAYFRIVVTEHTKKPLGEFLELLGSYDPHKKVLKCKEERIKYWLSKGVKASPTVHNLLINKKVISGDKKQSWKAKVKEKQEAGIKNQGEAEQKPNPEEAAPEAAPEEAAPAAAPAE